MADAVVFSSAALRQFTDPDDESATLSRGFSPRWPIRDRHDYAAGIQWTAITELTNATDWLPGAFKRLASLAMLPDDWDSYGAATPNSLALRHSREVLKLLCLFDLKPSHVDPSAEDGVCVSFDHDGRYGDIECFNSGEMLAVTSDGKGKPVVWEVHSTSRDVAAAICRIRSFLELET